MARKLLYAHSVCATNVFLLKEHLAKLVREGITHLHLDFMDFHYTHSFGLTLETANQIAQIYPHLILSAHLMVDHPYDLVPFLLKNPCFKYVFIPAKQYQSPQFSRLVQTYPHVQFGLQLEADDLVENYREIIRITTTILVMTIDRIGFTGEELNPALLVKCRAIKQLNSQQFVFTDGGLRVANYDHFVRSDADVAVGGSIVNEFAHRNFIAWFESEHQ